MTTLRVNLSDIEILRKGTGETKFSGKSLLDIYYRTLTNSTSWCQALGYFRLNSLRLLSYPLSKFILHNNGNIRIYCNEELSESDFNILVQAKKYPLDVGKVFKDIVELNNALLGEDEKVFLECIALLIQTERIDLKVLVKKEGEFGIAHEKNGIFRDSRGNIVVLTGSANASEQAFLFNKEDTTAFCSFWEEWSSTKTIQSTIEKFERTFANGDEEWKILEVDSAELRDRFSRNGFSTIDKTSLISRAYKLAFNNISLYSKEIQDEIAAEIMEHKMSCDKINEILKGFESKTKFDFPLDKLRPYQNDAINNWINNGYRGIMAMATGTGKTYVAFGAIMRFINEFPDTIVFVCCPYQHLLEQWSSEFEIFGANPILIYAKNNWRETLLRRLRQNKEKKDTLFIIATNNSLQIDSDFAKIMSPHWGNTLFIADEAHNVGSGQLRKALPTSLKARLGLSATIDRYFDEPGTAFLKSYFGEIVYELPLKDAIGKFLVNYEYYPFPIPLTDEEFEDYVSISAKINSIVNYEDPETEEILKNLLFKRARISNNSENKLLWIRENIEDGQNIEHALFYVGDEIFQETIDILSFEKNIVAQGFYGETSNREDILNEFNGKIIKCLVAMKCLDEGVNVPATKVAYFLASSGNPKEFIQRRGRILRESKETGKTHAIIYDLVSVPPMHINRDSDSFQICRSALKNQFRRIREFSSLAINKYGALNSLKEIIERFNLYTEI